MLLPGDSRSQKPALSPLFQILRVLVVTVCCVAVVAYVPMSWHWPLVHDMQVLHYVSFLIDRGWAPYRQILDMNMPGAYLVEGWALHVFGASDFGWRLWDYTLSAAMIASMVTVARRYDWMAGLYAGTLFTLFHARLGANMPGQRDQVIAVMLMAGTALCIAAVRGEAAWLMLPFGLCTAIAASIKPSLVIAGPSLLLLVMLEQRRHSKAWREYALWAFAGFVIITGIIIGFLVKHGSVDAFLFTVFHVLPQYVGTLPVSNRELIDGALQRGMWYFFALALVVALSGRAWWNWEQAAVALGAFVGLLSYLVQRKAFFQHRYTFLSFVILWSSLYFFIALQSTNKLIRITVALWLVCFSIYIVRGSLKDVAAQPHHDAMTEALQADLQTLGPDRLQHRVQCLDVVAGCMTALFHLEIVQSTGATGDLALFLPQKSPVLDQMRDKFWQAIQVQPTDVFIETNARFGTDGSFDKIDKWPRFSTYLRGNFVAITERTFSSGKGYRIYVRQGSPLLNSPLSVPLNNK